MALRAGAVALRIATLAVVALPLVAVAPAGAVEAQPGETVVVRRAHWPVRVLPRGAGVEAARRCAALAPGDVELLWNGEPLTVTAVDPRPLTRTHALLIDTSHSMVEDRLERASRFAEAKRAAIGYLELLPADERVLVASFDETLLLRTPPTLDREVARRAIEGLEVSYYTALWDSLYYLTLYLSGLPGEKVILLLSDGQDFGSTRRHGYEELLRLAGSVENLSIFPVGLALPRAGQSRIKHQLYTLAETTGGRFYEVERAALLSRLFGMVADRLESQRYLAFVPPALAGAGEQDRTGAGRRRVKIKVRIRRGVPCGIRSLGSSDWFASTWMLSRRALATLTPRERQLEGGLRAAAACLDPMALPQVGELWRLDVSGSRPGYPRHDAVLGSLATGHGLVGWVTDIMAERGPLFRRKTYQRTGELRVGGAGRPVHERRQILVVTPPLITMRERLTRPSELLLYMLRRELCAPADRETAERRAPFLIHGRTFIENRELLGRAMFQAREEYGKWAGGRAEMAAMRELDSLLATMDEPGRPDVTLVDDLTRAVAQQAADPRSGRPHEFLVEWLGDVTALRAAAELEVDRVNALLAPGENRPAAEQLADQVEASWYRLGIWFPPAFDVRIVALLLPAYDPHRDVVGFYRFVLPRPRSDDLEPEPLPGRPLGMLTVRWLLDLPGVRPAIENRLELIDLSSAPPTRRALRRAGCPIGIATDPGSREVVLTLAAVEEVESPGLLYITAYHRGGKVAEGDAAEASGRTVPSCVRFDVGQGSPPGLREIRRGLEEIVAAGE